MTLPPKPRGRSVSDYDYALPPGLVARHPPERRDESRLLVLPRSGGAIRHRGFRDIVELVRPGDVLVLNESRVLPARLLGRKPTGAAAEILLLRPVGGAGSTGGPPAGGSAANAPPAGALPTDDRLWEAIVRPGGKLKPGRRVVVSDELEVEIVDSTEGGGRIVRLETPLRVEEALERYGRVPLPPYLEREEGPGDRERYQTVYARTPGSVAAPTAGLHFTPELLDALEARDVAIARLTLHVGVGTFRPVEVDDPAEHAMHSEFWSVPVEAARTIGAAREGGGRVWAVGTTAVRTLESAADVKGVVAAGSGWTELFIHPPHDFRAVDAFVTNFHLPRSTLLMLVAAFAGYERTMEAYAEAIREGYRFYSYGDAMVVLP
ncbi:MAG: tRNA preQ1(34) S-adenosylmethionine ribosyltransferase-isomerase QueA [Gemmatimonadota bacterium]